MALPTHLIHDKRGGRCDINFDEHHSLIHIKGGIKYLIYSVQCNYHTFNFIPVKGGVKPRVLFYMGYIGMCGPKGYVIFAL